MVKEDEAYDSCEAVARAHYENFPVASILLPSGMRPHVAAIYAFARTADDFADEGQLSVDERYRLLDGWRERLHRAATSLHAGPPPGVGEPPKTVSIFLALGASIRSLNLPLGLFDDLLSAFRQDIAVSRYATWADVLDYCRRSANPIGRLVLRVAGHRDGQLDNWSDAVCTALQLTNFWQDLKDDLARGRLYLPEEERSRHHAHEADLARGDITPAWSQALRAAGVRTRALFAEGRPVCDALSGRLRYELRATWLGGIRILDRLERVGFDVMHARPTLGPRDAAWIAARMLTWTRRPAGLSLGFRQS